MTRSQLEAACKDFIYTMDLKDGPEGKKKPLELTVEMEEKDFLDIIKKAIPWIEPGDVFQPETLEVIDIITGKKKDENKVKPKKLKVDPKDEEIDAKKDELPPAPTLMDEITATESIKELKLIAQAEPEFKAIRGKLSSFKDIDSLREEMVWLLTGAKVPKSVVEQELPIVEKTQQQIAERLHEKLEKKPIKNPIIVEKEIIIPEDSYPAGNLITDISIIKEKSPFNTLFAIDPDTYGAVVANMDINGYDPAFPIILWNDIVVDGHTRLIAARTLGLKEIPVQQKEFENEKQALDYAIHNQRDRRNLSEAEILHCIEAIDAPISKKEAGSKGGKISKTPSGSKIVDASKTKTHVETAKKLKIGQTKVLDARTVLADADAKADVESGKKTISKAAKEVREKKAVLTAPKKEVKEDNSNKSMVDAAVATLRKFAGTSQEISALAEDADITFEEWTGAGIWMQRRKI